MSLRLQQAGEIGYEIPENDLEDFELNPERKAAIH